MVEVPGSSPGSPTKFPYKTTAYSGFFVPEIRSLYISPPLNSFSSYLIWSAFLRLLSKKYAKVSSTKSTQGGLWRQCSAACVVFRAGVNRCVAM